MMPEDPAARAVVAAGYFLLGRRFLVVQGIPQARLRLKATMAALALAPAQVPAGPLAAVVAQEPLEQTEPTVLWRQVMGAPELHPLFLGRL